MLLSILLLVVVSADSLIEVNYNFSEGSLCENSGRLLSLSIPISCNEALVAVLRGAGLPANLVSGASDLGDLCHSYCTVPMRQVGYNCPPILELNNAIDAACATNSNGTRCFDVREWVWPVLEQCPTHLCSEECQEELNKAHARIGCCLATTLSHTPGYHECTNISTFTLCSNALTNIAVPLTILLLVFTALAL